MYLYFLSKYVALLYVTHVQVKASEHWLCYMCCPQHHQVGLMSRRENWDVKLQELFLNDHEMEYVSEGLEVPILLIISICGSINLYDWNFGGHNFNNL